MTAMMGEEFKKRQETRAARRVQKEIGMKYTKALRFVREDIAAGGLVHTPKGLMEPSTAELYFPGITD